MDELRNPYAPGAGTQPPELTGRSGFLADAKLALDRTRIGRPAKSMMAVGLRGVGKTVLLRRIEEMASEAGDKAVLIEAREDTRLPVLVIPALRRVLLAFDRPQQVQENVKRALRALRSFVGTVKVKLGLGDMVEVGLEVEPERGVADSGDLEYDIADLFEAVARAAQSRETAVSLIIDELQYLSEPEMRAVIMACHRLAQIRLPMTVFGAGLPQLVALAGNAKSYAERLFDFPQVGALGPEDAAAALIEPAAREGVAFTPEAVRLIIEMTEGYPYFLQEWAFSSWNLAAASPVRIEDVRLASQRVIERLDNSFFRVRYDRLTPSEKNYMRAMAELGRGPHRSGDVAAVLGVKVTTVAPTRQSLIRKGMIYPPAHGDTAFTVPLFDAFMKRQMPDWTPASRSR